MTFLPIQFNSKIDTSKFDYLDIEKALDIVEEYFKEKGYNYIKRSQNGIVFHKMNLWTWFNFKSLLVSGIVKITLKDNYLNVKNGNWMVFLIAVPFLIVYLLGLSDKASFDYGDMEILFLIFAWIFGGNLIMRIIAHHELNSIL